MREHNTLEQMGSDGVNAVAYSRQKNILRRDEDMLAKFIVSLS